MKVKYLAQEHNAVPRPGHKPVPDPESSALTFRPPRLPHFHSMQDFNNCQQTQQTEAFSLVILNLHFFNTERSQLVEYSSKKSLDGKHMLA